MRKLLFGALLAFLVACGSQKQVSKETYGMSMKNAFENVFSKAQFDSICFADSLPTDLRKWQRTQFRDFETREGETMYLFIKRLGKGEQIYRLEERGDSFKITKREIK